jgi:hypothetical protein
VALSADGNTAIVGGVGDNPFLPSGLDFSLTQGAAWVWTRSGGVWTQQGNKLVGSGNYTDVTGFSYQGVAVALSGDGNTAIVGGTNGSGASWVWTRSDAKWTEQARLVQANVVLQGYSVSLSYDGNTALVGGSFGPSATWIWTRSGGVWSQQGFRLLDSGDYTASSNGNAACLSADGKTAIVGRGVDNDNVGAAWIFVSNTPRPRAARH